MESTSSEAPRALWDWSADAVIAAGVLTAGAGAWMFHPGAGLILIGVVLVLVGTRGFDPGS